ncbi:Fc receptor-like protein 4 isoform X4 [Antechinus flavipes]|uniref:Fc receptor-like protein 4 isoform X4 n=1 Tax=Antechinus flavipes TaxID=38775 RepID=UPI00223692BA|nr:Fc receptor-like protein 4 isoform X4 [Antechinus flavipes]
MDPFFILALALSSKPMIFINPPWTTFFKGEKVLLTCNGSNFYAPGKTKWYHKGEMLQETSGNNIRVNSSGTYKCTTNNSRLSDSVTLIFSPVLLIMRIPYPVFEGDSLILRCQEKDNNTLTQVTYYKNKKKISAFNQNSYVFIPQARLNDRGQYSCTAFKHKSWKIISNEAVLYIQELFSHPVLQTTDSQPIEGSAVTLRCEIRIPPQKSNIQLLFSFFREPGIMLLGQSRAGEFQISKFWREDSGSYWCEVETVYPRVYKQSHPIMMSARRIPITGVHIEVQPHGGHVIGGQKLVLLCSVAEGSGTITFSWHKEGTEAILEKKIQHSLVAEFTISAVRENDSGKYYCTADNNSSLIPSHSVSITVKRQDFSTDLPRSLPIQIQGTMESNACTQLKLQEIHSDEMPVVEDVIYSEVWSTQQGKEEAEDASEKPPLDKDYSVIYLVVKKAETQGDSTGSSQIVNGINGDTTDGFKNVLLS